MNKLAAVYDVVLNGFTENSTDKAISHHVYHNCSVASCDTVFLKNYQVILLIALIVMALVILFLIIFIITLNKKNKTSKKNEEETYSTVVLTKPIDDQQTMTVYGGETEVLFEENKKYDIFLTDRSDPHIRYHISSDEAVIGRNRDVSDIVIENEKSISQKHCKIFVRGSSVFISDLDSLNHTYVDGEMINDETEIVSGSELRLGRKTLTVEISGK